MDPNQDSGNVSSPTIDNSSFQSFQQNDLSTAFPSVLDPSHSLPDSPIPPGHAAHLSSQMSSMFHATEMDPPSNLSMSMQMSMGALTSPVDLGAMDVSSTLREQAAAPPALIPDFPGQPHSFANAADHRMNGMDSHDPAAQLLASPTTTTASSNVSHVSSPALNGVASNYLMGSSSSLASALDSMTVARSRSGSSASPGLLTSASSDLGFSSGGSGPPTSDPSLVFPPGYEQHNSLTAGGREDSPEQPGGAHLLVLGDMLKTIARTANSGSEACTLGPSPDTRNLVGMVDVLKKNVLLLAELVAAMQLNGGDGSGSSATAQSIHAGISSSLPGLGGLEQGQQLLNPSPPFLTPPNAQSEQVTSDSSDMSRKRCASSVAADRVLKVMKMEPPDDVSLQAASSIALHAPPSSAPISQFPFITPNSLSGTIVEQPSLPPSVPTSRPQSPSRMSLPSLNHLQDSQLSKPAALHPVHQFHTLDPSQSIPHPQVDFGVPPMSSASGTPVSAGFTPSSIPPTPTSWSDSRAAGQRHQHSLSGSSVLAGLPPHVSTNVAGPSTLQSFAPSNIYSPTRSVNPPHSAISPTTASGAPHGTRISRSSSFSNPFAFNVAVDHNTVPVYDPVALSRPPTSGQFSTRPSSPDYDNDYDQDDSDDAPGSSPPQDGPEGMEGIQSSRGAGSRRMSRTSPSAEGANGISGHANEVPQEYKGEVERIFFEFLTQTCSNLDATDAKGEPIHQTLMAKKMQRLDESPDFRPFKFRIQAFTNAFLEELARQGYPEEKIPMKKIRNFLWNQPYISRFNEEGKKSKSKGNHIWHVDAKKQQDGGWVFRAFQRRLAGAPPGVAYVGLRWSWAPRIWDPQASRSNMPVTYSAPSLPSWLAWKDDVLSGIPPPDAQNCDVTVEARFIQEGQEEMLAHTVHISIAPMAAVDASFTPSRRPSLVGDIHNPRRVMSDTVLPQTTPLRPLRSQSSMNPSPPTPVTAPDSQVVQVLTTAAQRVAQEAQSQVVASPMEAGHELQALAKQQHVLTVTAQAFKAGNDNPEGKGNGVQSNALAAAAQQVVLQAARSTPPSQQQITVKEVSVATQSAVAQAVEMVGPLSSEVDVLMTAKSLLQQQTRAPPQAVDPSQISAPLDPVRPHSTGMLTYPSQSMPLPVSGIPGFYAQ
ncbi:hypothetical protein EIP91_009465 [Steccherinum ochraceum]|uniref:Uncharacterized protein n=1 Tax=Steccherinum ochraceum TaxID=92696 RepID=A0A4R0RZW6_9APHY|nr:hypothetical protein EIP91_009465 [Steccherinum ochraceum]